MIRVRGFNKAKQLLARENFWESFTAPPRMATQIKQAFGEELSPQEVVKRIMAKVRDNGDRALFDYTRKLDRVELDSLEVSRQEVAAARNRVDKELISAFHLAAKRIHDFHFACLRATHRQACLSRSPEPKLRAKRGGSEGTGIVSIDKYLGQQICPLNRVGLYIPGGTAAYPSTVLMMAIPAKVAGVGEIIMVSPPAKNGGIPPATLVAADIAEVSRIFKVGGAQAIAALAFGTESIPKVDKICGPGNIFVTLAKKMVYGIVAIDGLQGPSEIVIVADETANPVLCAADLLAQAEHDPLASVILITTSSQLFEKVEREVAMQLGKLSRTSIAAQAMDGGMIVLVDNIDEAIELANLFAPEHLSLMVSNASSLMPRIHNAGCIFIGENSPVVLGDYVAGPSHVLPTGGSARFSSPLRVEDFLKVTNVVALDEPTMQELSQVAMVMAKAEGLDAHAQAIGKRLRAK